MKHTEQKLFLFKNIIKQQKGLEVFLLFYYEFLALSNEITHE